MAEHHSQEQQDRLRKLQEIRDMGVHPYPEKFERSHLIADLMSVAEATPSLVKELEQIAEAKAETYVLAGRVMMKRFHGKLAFGHLQDGSGRMQVAFMHNTLGADAFKFIEKKVDIGDFLGVRGELFRTKHGELTLLVSSYEFLGKSLRPLPEKFHGVKDTEILYRQRYLDLVMNPDTRKRFEFRSQFVKLLREFYWSHGFMEIETPILCNTASGALAQPFKTHHNALDQDVFLRIAPETYLKEAVVGGFERVFEVARNFRNEGIDPSHLQDFTMVEHYVAYWNYEDNMRFTEEMFAYILPKLVGSMKLPVKDRDGVTHEIDFTGPWPRHTLQELILKDSGINIDDHQDEEHLRAAIKKAAIHIDKIDSMGRGTLIDSLYKKVSRPQLIGPLFIVKHPIDLSPLARRSDDNPATVDRFQLVVNTWEVLNAYSELVDPVDQKQRFEDQAAMQERGDDEAHGKDDEYLQAMEHGMPPMSGFGMGIDRIVALLTQQDNLRDVVLFPLMRPEEEAGREDEVGSRQ